MVEEAYRSNAGIVGPKLVDYDHPDVLLEVGMAVDHYGVPFSGIEPGEVDQEQHDAVRDVFFVLATPPCSSAPTSSTSSVASTPRRSPAPTTSTCAGGHGSRAHACSSRPTRAVRHRRSTMQDTRPTSRNDQGDLKAFTRSRVRVCSQVVRTGRAAWVLPSRSC